MSDATIIAWTDHTFNIAWGCEKVSPGCAHCYAEDLSSRYGNDVWGRGKPRKVQSDKYWIKPIKWDRDARLNQMSATPPHPDRPELVFTSSMCDNFEDHPTITEQRNRLWALIKATPNLHWQILTKRADRIRECLPADWGSGYKNVWLGVSIENMDYAWRAEKLREIPAVVHFISYEPALGPLDDLDLSGIDWIIYGGESGNGYRQHDLAWPRAMEKKCADAGVAFFYKQSANRYTERGIELDGRLIRFYPQPALEGHRFLNGDTPKAPQGAQAMPPVISDRLSMQTPEQRDHLRSVNDRRDRRHGEGGMF